MAHHSLITGLVAAVIGNSHSSNSENFDICGSGSLRPTLPGFLTFVPAGWTPNIPVTT
jgi:hypothetical protein